MNFGMDGPQVTGWWVNPKTGDKFNAIDTYFEDNNLLIKTADGRLLNYNKIQDYVQTQNPDSIRPTAKPTINPKKEEIPASILAELDNGEDDLDDSLLIPDDNIYGITGQKQPKTSEKIFNQPSTVSQDYSIIDRALHSQSTPTLDSGIKWKNFPKREIEMLIDVLQISENEIVEYYINSVSLDSLREMVSSSIKEYIKKELHKEETTTTTTNKKKTTTKSK